MCVQCSNIDALVYLTASMCHGIGHIFLRDMSGIFPPWNIGTGGVGQGGGGEIGGKEGGGEGKRLSSTGLGLAYSVDVTMYYTPQDACSGLV